MTADQFNCCRDNRRGVASRSSDAAKLVLVHGMSIADAAELACVSAQTVRNALVPIRARHARNVHAYQVEAKGK